MNNRIKTIRDNASLSTRAFGDKIGISSAGVSKLETGANKASEQTIRSICREFGVRREWLENGEGEMYAPVTDDDAIGIIGQRMLDDPEYTGRLFRAVAAMGEDSWRILAEKVHELFEAYASTADADEPEE